MAVTYSDEHVIKRVTFSYVTQLIGSCDNEMSEEYFGVPRFYRFSQGVKGVQNYIAANPLRIIG
jgi:hypothetical protein